MTHSFYSRENNRALSILGLNIIKTYIALRSLVQDIDVSLKDLNRRIIELSEVNSCALDGVQLGLEKVVRMSSKMNSTAPAVVCGAFRAIFGDITTDSGKADDAWNAGRRFFKIFVD
ncbi:hypothetical protein GIB67_021022 [Kingdonia uniflora]|uniref:RNase III domain-containing protein n=1 Tax=Kingdonia uniflora TaxID=39325 RepID=A0A7J7N716_9MAGN|nr:hypothetical protein GIB67_021022 [Kingdonia uniflora]